MSFRCVLSIGFGQEKILKWPSTGEIEAKAGEFQNKFQSQSCNITGCFRETLVRSIIDAKSYLKLKSVLNSSRSRFGHAILCVISITASVP